ncbi:hypothetical protein KKG46_05285 [Patescibacteria group bacterium]|nr:hypothetical protein [Patescibacteria group bacterium]
MSMILNSWDSSSGIERKKRFEFYNAFERSLDCVGVRGMIMDTVGRSPGVIQFVGEGS